MKKIIFVMYLLISIAIFSDDYVLDLPKLRKSFIEFSPNETMAVFVRHSPWAKIAISGYEKETKEEAIKRIHKREINEKGYKYKGRNSISTKYFGVDSYEYIDETYYGTLHTHWIFLDNIKIAINYETLGNKIKDIYEELLFMTEEGVNPKKTISKRGNKKLYFKYKSFDEIFDLNILKKEFNIKKYPKLKIKDTISKNGEIIFTITPNNMKFNKKGKAEDIDYCVIAISENYVNTKEHAELTRDYNREKRDEKKIYKYLGENNISTKYLGVPAKTYGYWIKDNLSVQDRAWVEVQGSVGEYMSLENLIVSDDYTIQIIKVISDKKRDLKKYDKEYEEYIKSISKALKNSKNKTQ